MSNRYKEVLMTYLRRPFSSWLGAYLFTGIFWTGLSSVPGSLPELFAFIGELNLACFLWFHFREQMGGWRRKAVPGYVLPHAVVFAVLGVAAVLALPFLVAITHGQDYYAALSIAVLNFGFVGISTARVSVAVRAIGSAALMLLFFAGATHQKPLAIFLSGGHQYAAYCVLALGAAGTIWAVARLACLAEEDAGNSVPFEIVLFRRWSQDRDSEAASGGQKSEDLVSLLRDSANKRPGASRTRELWRKSGVFRPGMLPMLSFVLVPVWLIGLSQHPSQIEVVEGAQYVLPFLAVFPAIFGGGRWLASFQLLAMESLRPATRSEFIKGFAASFFLSAFKGCGVASAIFLVAVYLAGGGLVGALSLIPSVFAIILAQPLIFAFIWWITQYRNTAGLIAALSAPMGIGPILFPDANYWGLLAGGSVCTLLGLILIPFVYRRWMNLELG